ncbi:MAG TPA: hypothetical protein VE863_00255 [Pyrinomonadaceae bacterium]|jgi:tetratricopeptide (TPR) repeat protein|nr:hypothetical protein [Pyrinomonadaceae bacterium]
MRKKANRLTLPKSLVLALLLFGWSSISASGQTPSANPPQPSISAETLKFLEHYKRIVHVMDPKEVSREALAAYDRAVDAATAGNTEGAFKALEEALSTDIKKDESRVLWAPYSQLIADRGEFKRALGFLQNISIQRPKLAHVHTFLASTYGMYAGWLRDRDRAEMLKASSQSLAEYEVALALDPDSFQALMGHAMYLTYVPGKEAVWEAEFRRLIAMRPGDLHGFPFPSVYSAFVSGLIKSGRDAEARLVLTEGLTLYPKSLGLQALETKLVKKDK